MKLAKKRLLERKKLRLKMKKKKREHKNAVRTNHDGEGGGGGGEGDPASLLNQVGRLSTRSLVNPDLTLQ